MKHSNLPSIRSYPKELNLGDVTYKVRFVRASSIPGSAGECDPSLHEIRISLGLGRAETLKTFIHEVLHLLEFEHPVCIEHKLIYKLEEAVFSFLWSNYFAD
jgi:hypothetical protein